MDFLVWVNGIWQTYAQGIRYYADGIISSSCDVCGITGKKSGTNFNLLCKWMSYNNTPEFRQSDGERFKFFEGQKPDRCAVICLSAWNRFIDNIRNIDRIPNKQPFQAVWHRRVWKGAFTSTGMGVRFLTTTKSTLWPSLVRQNLWLLKVEKCYLFTGILKSTHKIKYCCFTNMTRPKKNHNLWLWNFIH